MYEFILLYDRQTKQKKLQSPKNGRPPWAQVCRNVYIYYQIIWDMGSYDLRHRLVRFCVCTRNHRTAIPKMRLIQTHFHAIVNPSIAREIYILHRWMEGGERAQPQNQGSNKIEGGEQWKLLRYGFWRGLLGFTFFPFFVALVHKNPLYVDCTGCSRNILLIYVKVW